MLIIKAIPTFTSDNAYEPWKKAILAVPLQSRSAIEVHVVATSTLQNELLVIIDQQKVCFMIIFAA